MLQPGSRYVRAGQSTVAGAVAVAVALAAAVAADVAAASAAAAASPPPPLLLVLLITSWRQAVMLVSARTCAYKKKLSPAEQTRLNKSLVRVLTKQRSGAKMKELIEGLFMHGRFTT